MSNSLLRTTLSGREIKTDENKKSCYVMNIIKLCFTIKSTNKGGKLRNTRSHCHNGLFWRVSLGALQFSKKNNLDFLLQKTRSHFHMCQKQNWTIQYPHCPNVDIMKKMTKGLAALNISSKDGQYPLVILAINMLAIILRFRWSVLLLCTWAQCTWVMGSYQKNIPVVKEPTHQKLEGLSAKREGYPPKKWGQG